jgi:hypothetical protein
MDLYIHFPIRLYGVVLKYLNTGTTLTLPLSLPLRLHLHFHLRSRYLQKRIPIFM